MEMAGVIWILLFIPTCFGQEGNEPENILNFAPTAFATRINEKCILESKHYVQALSKGSEWARKMYESSGKLPEFTPDPNEITHHQTGWFDKCLSVESDDGLIQGQYCSVFLDPEPTGNEGSGPRTRNAERPFVALDRIRHNSFHAVGLCLPSSCNDLDLRMAVAQQMTGSNETSVVVVTGEKYCYTQTKISEAQALDGAAVSVMIILGLLCGLVLVATVREWRQRPHDASKGSLALRALKCFSAVTNSKELFSTSAGSADDLSCLHGIRVLTTFWVLLTHCAQSVLLRRVYNRNALIEESSKWSSQIIGNGFVSVDSFFLMSGLLVAKSLCRDLDRHNGRLNIFSHYIHRYFRLTPVVAVVLALLATLFARLGSGPEWAPVEYMAEDCQKNWWINLLYLNNYVFRNASMNCMGETWYLACDMQMFWISPLIIYPLWRWKTAGLTWATLVMAASIGANLAVHFAWDLPPNFIFSRKSALKGGTFYTTHFYVQSHFRFPPYLLGILLGWFLHRNKGRRFSMKLPIVITGWTLSTLISLLVIFGLVPYLSEEEAPVINPYFAAFYGSLHRVAWAAAVGWVIFACVNGYGGWVNRMLSWKMFIPLGRLTFVVYLTHFNYITAINALSRKPHDFNMYKEIVIVLGIIAMSFVLAIVIAILVEIPFLNLERLINPSKRPNKNVPPRAVRSSRK